MGKGRSDRPLPGGGTPGSAGGPEPGRGELKSPKRRKRQTFSDAQRRAHVEAFEQSGQTQTAYCREQGFSASCLLRWRSAVHEESKPAEARRCGKASQTARHRIFSPEERRQAVEAFEKSGLTRESFCRTWGVSAASLAAWMKRYREDGPKGLEPRPRKKPARPHKKALPESTKAAIVATKKVHPDFGLRKVRDVLYRFFGIKVSCGSVRKTLSEEGIPPLPSPARRPRPRKKPPRRFERARPGELWQSDITSYVLARHSQRVYLTVFMDDHSRYIASFGLHLHQKQDIVIEALLEGTARFGKPREVLTDQGRQYFAWRGKSRFQKVLLREGIQHVVSRTHHPQTLGKCERFWETVQREFWERAQPNDLHEARERLAHFISHYNHFRPHQGIGGLVPADRFFGAESALRQTLEAELSNRELRLAIDQPQRKPVFLFGQIGDEQVSLHGERGRLVIQTPRGGRQEMEMDELGVGSAPAEESPDGRATIGRERAQAQADTALSQESQGQGAQADAAARAGALGAREHRGAGAGTQDVLRDPRVLAGTSEQAGGDAAAGAPGAAGVAALPAGARGYAGGTLEAATDPREGGHAEGSGERPQSLEEEERATRARACAGTGRDRALARAPGQPGAAEGVEHAPKDETYGEKKGRASRIVASFKRRWGRISGRGADSKGVSADGSQRGSE